MDATELDIPPDALALSSDPHQNARLAGPAPPAFEDVIEEAVSMIGFVAVAGPPVAFLAVPWLLVGIMLAGPFALLLTVVVLIAAMVVLIGLVGAILAMPYLLVRHLRKQRKVGSSERVQAARLVPAPSPRPGS